MSVKKNKFDFESDEQKTKYLDEVISFFRNERNEEIGYIAAENILDFFTQTMGDEIYKKALKDCKKILKEKFEELEVEFDILTPTK